MTMIGRTVYCVKNYQVLTGVVTDHELATEATPELYVIAVDSPSGTARIRTTGDFVAHNESQVVEMCWNNSTAWQDAAETFLQERNENAN